MTVHRVWLYRHSRALVHVEAASEQEARQIAAHVVEESAWTASRVVTDVQQTRKGWPTERYWTGPPDTGRWVYPETELFDEGEK